MPQNGHKMPFKAPMRSKYGNIHTTVDNVTFDSKAEANRYLELKILLKSNLISNLEIHPVFDLYAGIRYEADFQYIDDGGTHGILTVEDVKGVKTAVYRMKKKMFVEKYPHIKFKEI